MFKVKLSVNETSAPLPRWFSTGHDAKLTKFSMMKIYPAYLTSLKTEEDDWFKYEGEETNEEDEMKSLAESLEIEEAGIMETSLCENRRKVAHYIVGGMVRTVQKKTECDSCSRMLINCNNSASQTGSYL